MMDNLSFIKLKACFQVTGDAPLALPPYSGSTFRGVLGHALRNVRFGMKTQCKDCGISAECRYGNLDVYIFESPADHPYMEENVQALGRNDTSYPQPFVINPQLSAFYPVGDIIRLHFVLIGKAIPFLPFIACAFECMEKIGVGKNKAALTFGAITDDPLSDEDTVLIYDRRNGHFTGGAEMITLDHVMKWAQEYSTPDKPISQIHVKFLTPFRYRNQNRLGQGFTFQIFMKNIFRRITLLSVHSRIRTPIDYAGLLEKAEHVHIKENALEWVDWERFSNRQNYKMNLGGLIGDAVFEGQLNEFLPYLKLCEFLNVGKGGSFGLGKYQLIL